MRSRPIWSSLALLSAVAAPSLATADVAAVANREDTQWPAQEALMDVIEAIHCIGYSLR